MKTMAVAVMVAVLSGAQCSCGQQDIPGIVRQSACAQFAPPAIEFSSPAENDRGAMILGNGEVGAIAWMSSDGTLHTVLQRSDSWNEGARHVKVGAIDYVTGRPVDEGTFHQELSLERGEFCMSWKSGGKPVSVNYRVQHGSLPFAVCNVSGGVPDTEAKVVNWRLYPGGSRRFICDWKGLGNQLTGINGPDGKPLTFPIVADELVPDGWCHVNRNETVADMMKYYTLYQATDDLGKDDPLSDRVFGAITKTERSGDRTFFLTAVTSLHPCKSKEEWMHRTRDVLSKDGWDVTRENAARARHVEAWRKFWDRSYITVTAASAQKNERPRANFPVNAKLPICFGMDATGKTVFDGAFAQTDVTLDGKKLYSGVPKPKDRIAPPTAKDVRNGFGFTCRFTTKDASRPQRLIDNITPGGTDGFLVDLLGGRVRLLMGTTTVIHPENVPSAREVALSVSVSPFGDAEIVLDGKRHGVSRSRATPAEECQAVSRAWAAQRYVTACAGRGRFPIRFNGSIFTTSEEGDPDYRRWGNGYWWQNTRLPYYPVLAAGDAEIMESLFGMYLGMTDFQVKRTRKYLNQGGAYFPECAMPWGDHFPNVYGTKYAWKDRPDKLQDAFWHKYEWVGQLELCLTLLDYHAYTQDDDWFRTKALPAIREYVRFFDERYKLDGNGRYHMYPGQAVETWQDCTDPMPELAGLTRVTDLLLALPNGLMSESDRALFKKIRVRLPELPTRTLKDGRVVYTPGKKFGRHTNEEHPELYCVFPFRLCSFEKSNAQCGRDTYAVRPNKHYQGWKQEELFAAYLGMADEAAEHLVNRVLHNSAKEFRWPAYWGPNFDWRPDQCAGGNIQNILQSMLLQHDGRKIFLLPAWPKGWNCSFKLHAPYNTTVEGRVENGELKDLVVTPSSRSVDVVVCTKGMKTAK